ncbi:DUF4926 domain-containing protein [Geomonas sp. RF6]|uniref:DUF4926 domain-containing protein n=1 Tax=Geomonas sp. RF6 TaxID=2897342 RepID=UPI001E2AB1DF|nr:DUF4926 domain-containing protein [Geomonas sp. RF6]UFS70499.1 DUF4926 domain-containing protein [Geomonas sp. RF6]
MKFKEYDVVRLMCDVPSYNLKKGDTGTVLIVFDPQSDEYEVEFCDEEGITLALVTLKGHQLEIVWTEF